MWLADLLAETMARRSLAIINEGELLFVSGAGTPLSYTNWRTRVWLPSCAAAGVAGLRFHDLRSMAATALIAEGVDVKTTQVRMGHSSPHVTLALYARATTVADRAAAEAVGERYRPRDARAMDPSKTTKPPAQQETKPLLTSGYPGGR